MEKHQKINNTTYTKITAKIITLMLTFTLMSAFFYGEYIKRDAIENLAQIDARKTTVLIFESLYAAMSKGWNKSELEMIIERLNRVDEKLVVNVYRSEIVASLYGDISRDKIARDSDFSIKRSLKGEEILNVKNSDLIEYYYPVKSQSECLKCHTNAKVGDVLGVINISYPVGELKISLNEMINFFIGFIVLFSFVMFFILFINFKKYLLRPINEFVGLIDNIKNSQDIKQRVSIKDNIEEIRSMQVVFNGMLDSIEYQFYNDSLTGLKNRRSLLDVTESGNSSLLMIINIDRFQDLNGLYGDEVGDMLLKEFSEHLKDTLPNPTRLYRLHSDEFAYLSSSEMSLDEFEELGAYLVSSIDNKKFCSSLDKEVDISITIGISYGNSLLLPNADIALKIAKKEKKHQLTYCESMQTLQKYEQNINWAKRLNRAIKEDKIVPLFQPIARCRDGKISKYEALMRMEDENGELISPIHFLEHARKNKIYHKLTKAMLRKSFDTFAKSSSMVSINISAEDMLNSEITDFILNELRKGVVSKRVAFEIIESESIENYDEIISFIDKAKSYGAKISIDDFGTGYSNFEYLLKLKVDFIKIDGSMIKNIHENENSKMVTQTIVDFAKKMGVETVAEFVYSKAIFDIVKEIGVDYAQGYYFGQPSTHVNL